MWNKKKQKNSKKSKKNQKSVDFDISKKSKEEVQQLLIQVSKESNISLEKLEEMADESKQALIQQFVSKIDTQEKDEEMKQVSSFIFQLLKSSVKPAIIAKLEFHLAHSQISWIKEFIRGNGHEALLSSLKNEMSLPTLSYPNLINYYKCLDHLINNAEGRAAFLDYKDSFEITVPILGQSIRDDKNPMLIIKLKEFMMKILTGVIFLAKHDQAFIEQYPNFLQKIFTTLNNFARKKDPNSDIFIFLVNELREMKEFVLNEKKKGTPLSDIFGSITMYFIFINSIFSDIPEKSYHFQILFQKIGMIETILDQSFIDIVDDKVKKQIEIFQMQKSHNESYIQNKYGTLLADVSTPFSILEFFIKEMKSHGEDKLPEEILRSILSFIHLKEFDQFEFWEFLSDMLKYLQDIPKYDIKDTSLHKVIYFGDNFENALNEHLENEKPKIEKSHEEMIKPKIEKEQKEIYQKILEDQKTKYEKKISDQNHQKNEEIQQLKKQKEETETELNKLKEEEKKKPIVDQKELMALKMKSEKMQQLMMEKIQSQQNIFTEKIISLQSEICKLKGVEPTEENIEKVTGEKIIFIPKPTNLGGPLLNQVESPQNETEKIEPPTGGPPPPTGGPPPPTGGPPPPTGGPPPPTGGPPPPTGGPPPPMGGPPPPMGGPPPPMGGPPPPMGGPPPPMGGPPPPKGAPNPQSSMGRKFKKKPKASMLGFSWQKINANTIKNSWWENLAHEVDFDTNDFTSHFKKKGVPNPNEPKDNQEKDEKDSKRRLAKKTISFVSGKKASNLPIILKSIKMEPVEIKNSILSVDESKFTTTQLQNLLSLLPTEQEIEAIKEFKGDVNTLDEGTKFYKEIMDIPFLSERISSLVFKLSFASRIEELKPQIETMKRAVEDFNECKRFRVFLTFVLNLGNFMNSGSYRGNANGFYLGDLLKLKDTKSTQNPKITLLNWIVEYFSEKDPDVLNLLRDLGSCEGASRVSSEQVQADLRSLQVEMKRIEELLPKMQEPFNDEDQFFPVFSKFIESSENELKFTEASFESSKAKYQDLLVLVAESDHNLKCEDFFQRITTFLQHFKEAIAQNKKRKEDEERQKKLANRQRIVIKKKQPKEELKVDMSQVGAFDSLIAKMVKGDVFHAQRENSADDSHNFSDYLSQLK
ncbi:protein diaphanous [Anaeramoeba ignava]|uniref:Protein diaphanous n=1 Tax=Anaeramoeba ignava TaxID=1746090 RepID=A0A9Q0RF94_ANAIG|nr:protein diaphanous [Anaeramoeba ignava]